MFVHLVLWSFVAQWTFSFSVLGHASELEPESSSYHLLSRLPPELLHMVYQHLDICEYAGLLKASMVVRERIGGRSVEHELMTRAAAEMEALDLEKETGRHRLGQLVSAIRTTLRVRSKLPIDCPVPTRKLATSLWRHFRWCAQFSSSHQWQRTCMAALIGKNTLAQHLKFFSPKVLLSHAGLMLQAAASVGDFETLCSICEAIDCEWDQDLLQTIVKDIGYSGSVEFFDSLLVSFPDLQYFLMRGAASEAIAYGRRSLLDRILQMVDLLPTSAEPGVDVDKEEESESSRMIRELVCASCFVGDLVLTRELYEKYAPSKLISARCLEAAARGGRLSILEFVVEQGVAFSQLPELVYHTCFRRAIKKHHGSVVQWLLSQRDENGYSLLSPFADAAEFGNLAVMKLLLGRDEHNEYFIPQFPDDFLAVTVSVAVARDRLDVLEQLMALRDDPEEERFERLDLMVSDNDLFRLACSRESLNVAKFLLQQDQKKGLARDGRSLADARDEALHHACQHGHLSIVQLLLTHDCVKPAAGDTKLIRVAAQNHHWNIVNLLLQTSSLYGGKPYPIQGMDPGAHDDAVLLHAIAAGAIETVRLLLRRNADSSRVPLTIAITSEIYWAAVLAEAPEILEILGIDN